MHLLVAQKGSLSDGDEAVDLGQSPGDILFLSAADTELASVAAARQSTGRLNWRLASLSDLKHPMSLDTFVARMVPKARLIIVRALGGASYFAYALESLHAAASAHGISLAALPGDDRPDPGLEPLSTLDQTSRDRLWAYLTEGGAENARGLIDYAEAMLDGGEKPAPAAPLLKAGLWHPQKGHPALTDLSKDWIPDAPVAAICFYRALVQSGQTAPVAALCEGLKARGVNALPIFVSSLKDPVSVGTVEAIFADVAPDVVINATGFAVSSPGGATKGTVLESTGAPVLQAVFAGGGREAWAGSQQGLTSRDLAMHVALPEVDGRVLSRAVSFKSAARFDKTVEANIVTHAPEPDRVQFVAELASRWARLRRTQAADRRVAIVLANYPNRDGRIANGVGLDTPAGTIEVLKAMAVAGYVTGELPADGDALVTALKAGPTNAIRDDRSGGVPLSLEAYKAFFETLDPSIRAAVTERWGAPESDPFYRNGAFHLALLTFGNVAVGIQPARGYNIDPKASYHAPDLVPPHGYFAFYAWLRQQLGVHAVVHMGKHGNLEWLPGKALALSNACYPEAVLGAMPHVYPFIVNDPGEGTQAKRRTSAVIIDHLTPPLTRAESYGPLKDLEALVDEYYEASGHDPRRLKLLKGQILDLVRDIGLDSDAGIAAGDDDDLALEKLDAWLCDLKEMQIRDGLHIFGKSPEGSLLTDLTVALARVRRGEAPGDESLQRAIARDAGLSGPNPSPTPPPKGEGLGSAGDAHSETTIDNGKSGFPSAKARPSSRSPLWGGVGEGTLFDPLDCPMGEPWTGPKPTILQSVSADPWRTNGDTVERIELAAIELVSGRLAVPQGWLATRAVMETIETSIRPSVEACGAAEITGILTALDGRFVAPGPSGAPTRGRPDVLPTGRNFYSVDSRAVPTPAAWELGRKSAELLVTRHVQDQGEWPSSMALTAWGTSNMRTGGDDIAQALALIGAKPVWDPASRRVTGYEIIPLAMMNRPRVDVTLRISGFFRDAFPDQIALFDRAARAVAALEEDEADNPLAARARMETARLIESGMSETEALRRSSFRVFGSKPGAYGAGLQALIDEGGWTERGDLAEAFVVWGGYAYGADEEGQAAHKLFEQRLSTVEAVVQNQDNREHDLLDSDDYYQFEGGMTAAVEAARGMRPAIYHNDHSRPERPVIRSLEEEIARVVRGRAVNPKWIEGVRRHGYKGAFEMAATVDYLFAFAATTGAVRDAHFDAVYQAYLMDEVTLAFLREKNPDALREMAAKFEEAIERGLWTPKSNSAKFALGELAGQAPEHGYAAPSAVDRVME
ncbi:cobaltochelatase CobN subunit [Hoeflea halophila]|uniref:Cobaltochelatase subunit CobN n=1 Tax=Hoeflea halophila TaxID=714899 RepID=A0A286HNP7_9HYPH|nr:cobaltochelatase subunit CobN [Hoeflea halophila]SOE09425.1 cobaltochelatase CobN subunit [Hoeflea halophila]